MERETSYIIERFLDRTSKGSGVLLVEGARQVGKTYMVEEILRKEEGAISIDLEKEPDIKVEIDNTKNFEEFSRWLSFKKGFRDDNEYGVIFIDEAQESVRLGSYVRLMKESWKNKRVILTGSSMNLLFSGDERVPVGRIEYLTVWPFNFTEFLKFGNFTGYADYLSDYNHKDVLPDAIHNELLGRFDEYLLVGGMPEAVKAYYEKRDYVSKLRFLVASQQADFYRKEANVKNHLFLDALKAVAGNVGFPFKKAHISQNIYDATKILELLKRWYLVIEVPQKGTAPTQTNFHSKTYLYDLGILRLIRESATPRISAVDTLNEKLRIPLGGLIENAVLLNMLEGRGGFFEVVGWKNSSQDNIEVDFIYKNEDEIFPVEVKAAKKVGPRHAKNLVRYLKGHGLKRGVIVSLAKPQVMKIADCEIVNWPAYLFRPGGQ